MQNQNKLLIKTIIPISNKFIEFYPILVILNGKSPSLLIPMIGLKHTTLNVVMIINDRVNVGHSNGGHNVLLKLMTLIIMLKFSNLRLQFKGMMF